MENADKQIRELVDESEFLEIKSYAEEVAENNWISNFTGQICYIFMTIQGVFYTGGTLVVSLGMGSTLGYLVFLYAKGSGMLGIVSYHYPVMQAVVLVIVVTVIQLLLTYVVIKNFRKQSMIDRIRSAD